MRELLRKATTFTRVEFWALTSIYGFIMFFFIVNGFDGNSALNHNPFKSYFEKAGVPFHFYENYFFPQLLRNIWLYIAVVALNFIIIPRLLKRDSLFKALGFVLLIFILSFLVFGVTGTYMREDLYITMGSDAAEQFIFVEDGLETAMLLLFILGIYTTIKYGGIYLLDISETIHARYAFIRREAIVATVIWLVGLMLLRIMESDFDVFVAWLIVVPSAIALYLASFHTLIPRSSGSRYPFLSYALKCVFVLVAGFFGIFLVVSAIFGDSELGAGYSSFNSFFQLLVTVPVTWMLYKRYLAGNEEIIVLQKELKRSSANIDFLRSQINPHFLFNALNTLYGTAIQENADRTGEGIQKLGDMMRFMLQENMQDKISLTREIDYLNNYISLQRLRTDANPIVQINTQIQETENFFQIAPMLLIPFVENAFKHGISFREPSHIKVTLEVKDNTLYFDVYNSKHAAYDNDPEKDKSGIGLENVKQRLKLAYPNKHELQIRDTTKEFFVHLTIQLARFA